MSTEAREETKVLRNGITTGSCAAAAAKAAARMALSARAVEEIEILTPAGIRWRFDVLDAVYSEGEASCAVEKDSGDDPDITNGVLVYADVTLVPAGGIAIDGGEGVGRVTRPGLDRAVGEAAINTVPRRMIAEAVSGELAAFGFPGGAQVVIRIPGGAELAKKTFNPKLGIKGGLSVIGTSGIVRPMSEDAILDTIRAEIRIRSAERHTRLYLVIGNYGERFLEEVFAIPPDVPVTCSNYIRDAVRMAAEAGFTRILLTGHTGKLVKVAAGMPNTHSRYGDPRMEVMERFTRACGYTDDALFKIITTAATTEDAFDALDRAGISKEVSLRMLLAIRQVLSSWAGEGVQTEAVMFRNGNRLAGMTEGAADFFPSGEGALWKGRDNG